MIKFKTLLKKFGPKGEKTGWTYVDIPKEAADKLNPGFKKSFRVKGKIDEFDVKGLAVTPMGEGNFILAINAAIRKAIKKSNGSEVELFIEIDDEPLRLSIDMIDCLKDEPDALKYFEALPMSHRNWFSNWVKAAKTIATTTKRISIVVKACQFKMGFAEMMKAYKQENMK